jgi:hypothetical protein
MTVVCFNTINWNVKPYCWQRMVECICAFCPAVCRWNPKLKRQVLNWMVVYVLLRVKCIFCKVKAVSGIFRSHETNLNWTMLQHSDLNLNVLSYNPLCLTLFVLHNNPIYCTCTSRTNRIKFKIVSKKRKRQLVSLETWTRDLMK